MPPRPRVVVLLLLGVFAALGFADLSVARFDLAGVGAGNYIAFAGGQNGNSYFSTVDLYDSFLSQWSVIGNLSSPRAFLTGGNTASGFLFAGGTDGASDSASVDLFDVGTRAITAFASLGSPRSRFASASAGSIFAVAGGASSSAPINTISFYDTRVGSWNESITLSSARQDLAAASAGNSIVFAGGLGAGVFSTAAELFNVQTLSFQVVSPGLSKPRARLAAAGAGHYIVFAGGVDQTGWLDDVDVFDTDTNQFNAIFAPLSEARSDLAAAAIGNKLIFAGGRTGVVTVSSRVDIFDVTTLTWTVSPKSLSVARANLAAAATTAFVVFAGGASAFLFSHSSSHDSHSPSSLGESQPSAVADFFTPQELTGTSTSATTAVSVSSTESTSTSTTSTVDITTTATTAAAFSSTHATTVSATTTATASTTGTRNPAPPTDSPQYTVDGNVDLSGSWTAPAKTVFITDLTTSLPRLTVEGTAFLGGTAVIKLPESESKPFTVRLVAASEIHGVFAKVIIDAPNKKPHCYKYLVEAITPVLNVYSVEVTPRHTECNHLHLEWVIVAAVFGGLVLLGLCAFIAVCWWRNRKTVYVKICFGE